MGGEESELRQRRKERGGENEEGMRGEGGGGTGEGVRRKRAREGDALCHVGTFPWSNVLTHPPGKTKHVTGSSTV